MKKLTVLSVVAASLLLIGCGDGTTKQAAQETTPAVVEKTAEAVTEVAEKTAEVANDAVDATKEAVAKVAEKTAEVAAEAKEAVTEAVAEKTEEANTTTEAAPAAAAPEVNLTACAACHGTSFEKAAMGVSKVVKDLSKEDIVAALKGYKAGTYGGSMKALMQGQIASFDDAMIEAAAAKIKGN